MAYGDSTTVNTLTNTAFGATQVTAAIVTSDLIVDSMNANASAANKTLASNLIAAAILEHGYICDYTKGSPQYTGPDGSSYTLRSLNSLVPTIAKTALRKDFTYYGTDTPSYSGGW